MADTQPQADVERSGEPRTEHEHPDYDLLPDRRFLLLNAATGTQQCFETEHDALEAVNDHISESHRWSIILTPPRTGASYKIHSGHGPTGRPER